MNREQLTEGFEYLDDLRESGRTNMFGASTYMVDELGWGSAESKECLGLWMKTFDGESTVEDRVESVCSE